MQSLNKRIMAAGLLCFPMAVLSAVSLNHDLFRHPAIKTDTLPATLGDWKGASVPLTEAELSMLDSPAACQRIYADPSGDRVQILLLQVDDSQNAHDPKLCMSGSGYRTAEDKVVQAPWAPHGKDAPISRAVFTKDTESDTMYYWLQTRSGNIADLSGGFKLEALRRVFTGSTIRGIAVRVISLPRMDGDNTSPDLAKNLWQKISQQVGIDRLVDQID